MCRCSTHGNRERLSARFRARNKSAPFVSQNWLQDNFGVHLPPSLSFKFPSAGGQIAGLVILAIGAVSVEQGLVGSCLPRRTTAKRPCTVGLPIHPSGEEKLLRHARPNKAKHAGESCDVPRANRIRRPSSTKNGWIQSWEHVGRCMATKVSQVDTVSAVQEINS